MEFSDAKGRAYAVMPVPRAALVVGCTGCRPGGGLTESDLHRPKAAQLEICPRGAIARLTPHRKIVEAAIRSSAWPRACRRLAKRQPAARPISARGEAPAAAAASSRTAFRAPTGSAG